MIINTTNFSDEKLSKTTKQLSTVIKPISFNMQPPDLPSRKRRRIMNVATEQEIGMASLPSTLVKYCKQNHIDIRNYTMSTNLARYVRINPEKVEITCSTHQQSIDCNEMKSDPANTKVSLISLKTLKQQLEAQIVQYLNKQHDNKGKEKESKHIQNTADNMSEKEKEKEKNGEEKYESQQNENVQELFVENTPFNDFLKLESFVKVSHLGLFKENVITGMDIASGICVRVLNPKPNENILDLCCAPGNKLVYISQLMKKCGYDSLGTVTGVDISKNRLSICKKMVQKFKLYNVRLFCQDATVFDEIPKQLQFSQNNNNNSNNNNSNSNTGNTIPYCRMIDISCLTDKQAKHRRRKMRKLSKKRDKVNQEQPSNCNSSIGTSSGGGGNDNDGNKKQNNENKIETNNGNVKYYDKVLVDAQCTHDGSIRHVTKYNIIDNENSQTKKKENCDCDVAIDKNNKCNCSINKNDHFNIDNFEKYVIDDKNIKQTIELQKKLILNGLKLVSPNNGILVYCTCSFNIGQNENVVQWLLNKERKCCRLIDISSDCKEILKGFKYQKGFKAECNNEYQHGIDTSGCIRLDPITSNTSGLFIAKIQKYDVTMCENKAN